MALHRLYLRVTCTPAQGLQQLVCLEQFFASTNRVADVSPLVGCQQLQWVSQLVTAPHERSGYPHPGLVLLHDRTLGLHRNSIARLDPCLSTLTQLCQLTGAWWPKCGELAPR